MTRARALLTAPMYHSSRLRAGCEVCVLARPARSAVLLNAAAADARRQRLRLAIENRA